MNSYTWTVLSPLILLINQVGDLQYAKEDNSPPPTHIQVLQNNDSKSFAC